MRLELVVAHEWKIRTHKELKAVLRKRIGENSIVIAKLQA